MYPIAVAFVKLFVETSAPKPNAVLEDPEMLVFKASAPTAVLLFPLVFALNEDTPNAVFKDTAPPHKPTVKPFTLKS